MIGRQQQAFLHKPDEGQFGDCYRTCLAMMADVPRDTVPHEHRKFADATEQHQMFAPWLNEQGLAIAAFRFSGADLDWVKLAMETWNPGLPCILSGKSPRGTSHSVVMLPGGEILDPHPDQTGLVGPESDGAWTIEVLASARRIAA